MKLYQGDCLQVMDELIKEGIKVDAIITDPPFNLVEKMGGSIQLFRQSEVNPRGKYTKESMSYDVGFDQVKWIKKAVKLLKRGGHIIIFNDWENMGDIAKELRIHNIQVKSLNHWQKTNPQPAEWKRRFVSGREYFIHAVKKGKYVFNVDRLHNGNIEMGLTKMSEKEHGFHPNQKPIKLFSKLIKILTNEQNVILDPFMGSGSSGVAARHLNRDFIGIELDEKYFNIAQSRIGLARHKKKLFEVDND
jgi:DNA modification methylase